MTMPPIVRRGVLKLHSFATGRKILQRLEELNRTQWLSPEELAALQREKLQRLVTYAYQNVPYYHRTFDEAGFHPDQLRRDPAYFQLIPILTKQSIHENFSELQTVERHRREQLCKVTTSGSTGQPLVFMQDSDFRDSVTADIQRHLGWAGWTMGQLHAYIWGANFEVDVAHSLRSRLIDWEWNRFLTNAFALTDEALFAFTKRVQEQRPHVLYGYASSLYRFAQYVNQSPYRGITFDGIISSAEVLLPAVRQVLEETFHCRVFDRYGTKELGGIACECDQHQGLHVSAENCRVEILRDDCPVEPGNPGSIIVTNLNNLGMPFIRYSVGDEGAWYDGAVCPCGRASPRLKTVEGRIVDMFQTRDGRAAWAGFAGAGYSCLAHPSVKQFQVVQETLDKMVVRIVKSGDLPASVLDELVHTIHIAFGDNVVVEFEFPDQIAVLASGKHQYAISKLNRV
jgi:phenylacetate-CoA ligase